VTLFFILADGTEGELVVARQSAYSDLVKGPYQVIVDKTGILANANFVGRQPLGDRDPRLPSSIRHPSCTVARTPHRDAHRAQYV